MNNGMIEILTSQNGHPIPVINGTYLHNIVDPIDESRVEVGQFEDKILNNKYLLILGLGFGYHIDECERIARNHQHESRICVVEPNTDLVEQYKEKRQSDASYIFCKATVEELFSDKNFIQFLLLKPAVIPHRASFNLNEKFFKKFLSYRPDNTITKERLSSEVQKITPSNFYGHDLNEIRGYLTNSDNSRKSSLFYKLLTELKQNNQDNTNEQHSYHMP